MELRLALNYVAETSLEFLILLPPSLRHYSYTKPGFFIPFSSLKFQASFFLGVTPEAAGSIVSGPVAKLNIIAGIVWQKRQLERKDLSKKGKEDMFLYLLVHSSMI